MAEKNTIPSRSEINEKDKWCIADLYSSDEEWENEHNELIKLINLIPSFEGTLSKAKSLLSYCENEEAIERYAEDLANYAQRCNDVDTRVAKYQDMSGRIISTLINAGTLSAFAIPEIISIPENMLEKFYFEVPSLNKYRRYLSEIRRQKEHILSPKEEHILAAAADLAQAPENISSMFNDADLSFPDAIDSNGKKRPLSHSTYISYMESTDRTLRKSAFENIYNTYNHFRNSIAATLSAEMKQRLFFANMRHYPSSLHSALDSTNVPVSVYSNLIEAVHNNIDKMHRYVRLRKKMLNLDELHMYDIYTPLIPDVKKDIPFDEAKQTVFSALEPMGDYYRSILKEGFDNRWIDVYENTGKRSGAYSAGTFKHPYVLLNYSGTLDSQFTLAHEMGHALHSYLSTKNQPVIDHDYVIFVAEVASTCNEALLMEYLLNNTSDIKERAFLINHFLDQFKGTLYRQTMFAEFEMNIGNYVANGQPLTADFLCAEYARLNKFYYGPDMEDDAEIASEWMRIPHFYYNYYVFQYATGYSAAIALSQRILKEGKCAVNDYLSFLSGGCSKSPIELLKIAGVDMSSPAPINSALELFGKLLDEMESIVGLL